MKKKVTSEVSYNRIRVFENELTVVNTSGVFRKGLVAWIQCTLDVFGRVWPVELVEVYEAIGNLDVVKIRYCGVHDAEPEVLVNANRLMGFESHFNRMVAVHRECKENESPLFTSAVKEAIKLHALFNHCSIYVMQERLNAPRAWQFLNNFNN